MIKWIFITLMVLIALLDYALIVACSKLERREEYEAYQRWKERRGADDERTQK